MQVQSFPGNPKGTLMIDFCNYLFNLLDLTLSFGWDENDVNVQHDIQEVFWLFFIHMLLLNFLS